MYISDCYAAEIGRKDQKQILHHPRHKKKPKIQSKGLFLFLHLYNYGVHGLVWSHMEPKTDRFFNNGFGSVSIFSVLLFGLEILAKNTTNK